MLPVAAETASVRLIWRQKWLKAEQPKSASNIVVDNQIHYYRVMNDSFLLNMH